MTLPDRLLAALLRGLFAALRALGPIRASNLGGGVARLIGPLMPVSRVADANLRAALPELDAPARRRMIRQVWDNLGRTIAEMPHLDRLRATPAGPGWELLADPAMVARARAGKAIFFAGHLANWEILPAVARAEGVRFGVFYRAAGNLAVDQVVRGLRSRNGGPDFEQFPKGAPGARLGVHFLRRGGVLGLLVDQKTNDGIPVPFFGRPAMTAPALAALAKRFDVPVIPARVERLGPARFRITLAATPMALPDTGDPHTDIAAVMLEVNQRLEAWIRERPGEWLWLHRRWPKDGKARPGALPLDPAGGSAPRPASMKGREGGRLHGP